MILTIEATDQLTHWDGVPVRVWKGKTESGVDCFVFVHRVAVHKSKDQAEFERALREIPPGRVVPLSAVL